LVLLGDLLLAAAEPGLLAARVQLLGQVAERRGAGQLVVGRAHAPPALLLRSDRCDCSRQRSPACSPSPPAPSRLLPRRIRGICRHPKHFFSSSSGAVASLPAIEPSWSNPASTRSR